MSEVAGVDPNDHVTLTGFKHAVYNEAGAGSWLDDMKLEIVWREAHDKTMPDYLDPLLGGDSSNV